MGRGMRRGGRPGLRTLGYRQSQTAWTLASRLSILPYAVEGATNGTIRRAASNATVPDQGDSFFGAVYRLYCEPPAVFESPFQP